MCGRLPRRAARPRILARCAGAAIVLYGLASCMRFAALPRKLSRAMSSDGITPHSRHSLTHPPRESPGCIRAAPEATPGIVDTPCFSSRMARQSPPTSPRRPSARPCRRPVRLQSRFSDQARLAVDRLRQSLCNSRGHPYLIPNTFENKDLRKYVGRPIVDAYSELLVRRSRKPLFLLRAVVNGAASSDDEIAEWMNKALIAPVETTLQRIAAGSVSSDEELSMEECNRLELAEQEAGFLLDDCRSIDLVGRYDGMNTAEREAHLRNVNDFYNPFALLVSRVGEEEIISRSSAVRSCITTWNGTLRRWNSVRGGLIELDGEGRAKSSDPAQGNVLAAGAFGPQYIQNAADQPTLRAAADLDAANLYPVRVECHLAPPETASVDQLAAAGSGPYRQPSRCRYIPAHPGWAGPACSRCLEKAW